MLLTVHDKILNFTALITYNWHCSLISECNIDIYRVSQEECARLRESVPYVKLY